MERALTWSYGGGTQSIAIAVLVAEGVLPKPDCVVIADTGREATETWEYTDKHVRPLLAKVGVEIEIAPHSLAKVDLYTSKDEMLIPAFNGTKGQLNTFCSNEWKRRVVRRYLRQRGYGPRRPITTWLGISLDEIGRMKDSDVQWQRNYYPLVELERSRDDCRKIVMDAGLPEPPKSSCWMCPWRRNRQWLRLKEHYPQDWANAVALDAEIRARDPQHDLYLHDSRVPLAVADLGTADKPVSNILGEVEGCDSGYCYV